MRKALRPLGNYLLGYDLRPAALRKAQTQQRRIAEISEPADPALLDCEDGLLDIYADLGALYRPQTETEPDELAVRTENTQEYFVSFLQWLDADRAELPPSYRARLQRALSRFGVSSLERTPALLSALMWLFRSFARLGELSPLVTAILQRRDGSSRRLAARGSPAHGPSRPPRGRHAGASAGHRRPRPRLALPPLRRTDRWKWRRPSCAARWPVISPIWPGTRQRRPRRSHRPAGVVSGALRSLLLDSWRTENTPLPRSAPWCSMFQSDASTGFARIGETDSLRPMGSST